MSALFHYPKDRHVRTERPRQFKRYQTYKRVLRTEFSGVCVYCRAPKISNPSQIFTVDHYRPKGLPQFAGLVADYGNLYYCCHACNSRKGSYWPADELADPHIVNPCDHQMASHMKFDASTGEVKAFTPHGVWTSKLLGLNDGEVPKYRRVTLATVRALNSQLVGLEIDLDRAKRAIDEGKLPATSETGDLIRELEQQIVNVREALLDYGVGVILPPVRESILGLTTVLP
ncbi:HNH endonuclease [Stenotrophomonas sp. YIM B06876]|uniref:HNH endonuclease n=1 Tax=Stenotrophomonas sp. YIM B06876 TaxID=3060211 RepID=UPI00273889AA|nr:HNH endonuclease [Stenotrophomonas sp. YIM B06876]